MNEKGHDEGRRMRENVRWYLEPWLTKLRAPVTD